MYIYILIRGRVIQLPSLVLVFVRDMQGKSKEMAPPLLKRDKTTQAQMQGYLSHM